MLAIIARIASSLGISVTPAVFSIGVVVGLAGGGLVAKVAYNVGDRVGYSRGYKEADKQAEINELQARLAEAQRDAEAARQASEDMAATAKKNQEDATRAQEQLDAYAEELKKLGDDCRCSATRRDVDRMRDNHSVPKRK